MKVSDLFEATATGPSKTLLATIKKLVKQLLDGYEKSTVEEALDHVEKSLKTKDREGVSRPKFRELIRAAYMRECKRRWPQFYNKKEWPTRDLKETAEGRKLTDKELSNIEAHARDMGERIVMDGRTVWGGLGNRSGLHSYAQTAIDDKWNKSGAAFMKKMKAATFTTIELQTFRNKNRDTGSWVTRHVIGDKPATKDAVKSAKPPEKAAEPEVKTSDVEQKVKDLCKKHGCSMRSAKEHDGYVSFELAGKDDYSDISKVFDAVDGDGPHWRRAMGMGYVKFYVNT